MSRDQDLPTCTREPSHALPNGLLASTGFLLQRLAQQSARVLDDALAPLQIRLRHYGILTLLAEDGPSPQVVIGARLGIDRTTVVGLIDDLERYGLVERRPDPSDRRAYRVQLTPAGETTRTEASARLGSADDQLLAPLSRWERRHLDNVLLCLLGLDGAAQT